MILEKTLACFPESLAIDSRLWLILSVGTFTSLVGYGILWLAVTQTLPNPPYLLLWFALVISSNGSAWLTTLVLVTSMRNFPVSRGKVTGILKGYGRLSVAVFTQIYSLLLHNDSSKFLMLLTIGIPVVCFSTMFLCHLGCISSATTIFGNLILLSGTVSYILVAVMVIFLMALIAVPVKMTLYPKRFSNSDSEQPLGSSDSLGQGKDDKIEPLLGSSAIGTLESSNDDNPSEVPSVSANVVDTDDENCSSESRTSSTIFPDQSKVVATDNHLCSFVLNT
ncbi:hypothetical protein KIW84_075717 [Lathyrus oleraceus]|uniref:Nodulin-like domain-containing protein n=1 Tax=Pisum sativum TaxID=3888 RepID=A0A9D4VVP8_PEA|nr:hypothetical protein KIW84_075717 [Pisum sativum]